MLKPSSLKAAIASLAMCMIITPAPSFAAKPPQDATLVIEDNAGGLVRQRQLEIQDLKKSRTQVRLQGEYCISTCTMYLHLPAACVDPDTKFGFHAPSFFGIPGSGAKYVPIMVAYYPGGLKEWYMQNAAHRTLSWISLTGQELTQFGIKLCDTES